MRCIYCLPFWLIDFIYIRGKPAKAAIDYLAGDLNPRLDLFGKKNYCVQINAFSEPGGVQLMMPCVTHPTVQFIHKNYFWNGLTLFLTLHLFCTPRLYVSIYITILQIVCGNSLYTLYSNANQLLDFLNITYLIICQYRIWCYPTFNTRGSRMW